MKIHIEFDPKHNLLRATLEGQMTGVVLLDLYAKATEFMQSRPPCRAILDFSRVTDFEVSSEAIRKVAASPPAMPRGYMRVLVIPQIFIYGLARMFQILSEKTRPELHVVRSMEEALKLLGAEDAEFHELPIE